VNDIRPEAHFSIIELARVTGYSEGRVRALLGEGKLPSVKLGQRRWLPESAVIHLLADRLVVPAAQKGTLAMMRRNAEWLGVQLSSDEDLIRNAHAYLRGEYPNVDVPEGPTPTHDAWGSVESKVPVAERELVEAGTAAD